jgi:hypothetical protein
MRHSRNYIGPPLMAVAGARAAVLAGALAAAFVGATACDRGPAPPASGAAEPPPAAAPPAATPPTARPPALPDSSAGPPAAARESIPGGPAIARGTNIAVVMASPACTDSSRIGDTISAIVTGAVMGSGGAVIPAGTSVVGSVRAVGGSLGLAFDSARVGPARIRIDALIIGQPQIRRRRAALRDVLGAAVATARDTGTSTPWSEITTTPTSAAFCVGRGARLTLQLTADAPIVPRS